MHKRSWYRFDGCTKTNVNLLVLLTKTGRIRVIKPLAVDVHPGLKAKMLRSGESVTVLAHKISRLVGMRTASVVGRAGPTTVYRVYSYPIKVEL